MRDEFLGGAWTSYIIIDFISNIHAKRKQFDRRETARERGK
jgi:hypothetical protein